MPAFVPKYKFLDTRRISGVDAQAVGELCDELSNTVGLTPKTLLDANRKEGTPLYNYFEWRDDVAAEAYRCEQARYVIRSIVVVEEEKPTVRAFHSVIKNEGHTFKSIETIVKSEDLTNQLLESAKRDLFAFQVKYSALKDYVELADVFTSIEKLRN